MQLPIRQNPSVAGSLYGANSAATTFVGSASVSNERSSNHSSPNATSDGGHGSNNQPSQTPWLGMFNFAPNPLYHIAQPVLAPYGNSYAAGIGIENGSQHGGARYTQIATQYLSDQSSSNGFDDGSTVGSYSSGSPHTPASFQHASNQQEAIQPDASEAHVLNNEPAITSNNDSASSYSIDISFQATLDQ